MPNQAAAFLGLIPHDATPLVNSTRLIAEKLIRLAQAGECHPDVLCEQVLKDIRTPQMEAAGS